jgi:FMN-dependent NADH-azoreductase
MKRILFVKSSLNGLDGTSTGLGSELVTALTEAHPGSTVNTLDLSEAPLPHLGAEEFEAWGVAPGERSAEQAALAARSDRLIDQLLAHDTLVLAVPMYNMTIPSTLKAWIDRVVRAGKTFRYTEDGPVGLARGIEAYAVFARGGRYRGTPLDTQTGYIEGILGLIGIDNVKTIFAEGLAMGGDSRHESLEAARNMITSLAGHARPEVRYANA